MDRTPEECKAMAGEMLAWLDEKEWSNEDKVATTSGCFPVLLARIAKDRKQFDKMLSVFQEYQRATADVAWQWKSDGKL